MARPDNFYINGLVDAAKRGSTEAFAELYAATVKSQFELANYFLYGDEDHAEDIVREVYVTALYSLGELKEAGTFISELTKINFQLCCAFSGEVNGQTRMGNIPLRQVLALPGAEAPAVYLRFQRGLSFKRIASALCMDEPAVIRCFRSGRRRLGTKSLVRRRRQQVEAAMLDSETAERLLGEILEISSREASRVPYEELETYSVYRKERFGLQKALLLVLLAALLAVPFFFVAPDFSLDCTSESIGEFQDYKIVVNNLIPVKTVNASMGSKGIAVKQTGEGVYELKCDESGELKVNVTLSNGQYRVVSTEVETADTGAPVLISRKIENGKVVLEVKDSGIGIDYDGVYGVEMGSGIERFPEDHGDGYIIFAFPKEKMSIFIPDMNGNTLQVIISPVGR